MQSNLNFLPPLPVVRRNSLAAPCSASADCRTEASGCWLRNGSEGSRVRAATAVLCCAGTSGMASGPCRSPRPPCCAKQHERPPSNHPHGALHRLAHLRGSSYCVPRTGLNTCMAVVEDATDSAEKQVHRCPARACGLLRMACRYTEKPAQAASRGAPCSAVSRAPGTCTRKCAVRWLLDSCGCQAVRQQVGAGLGAPRIQNNPARSTPEVERVAQVAAPIHIKGWRHLNVPESGALRCLEQASANNGGQGRQGGRWVPRCPAKKCGLQFICEPSHASLADCASHSATRAMHNVSCHSPHAAAHLAARLAQ